MAEPRYETACELGQRIGHTDSVVCTDCDAFVMDTAAHTRFHSPDTGIVPRSGRIVITCTQHGRIDCPCLTAAVDGSSRAVCT